MKYTKGYKYQVKEDFEVKIDILGYNIFIDYIELTHDGILRIKKGYAWDGASGPTFDSKCSQRGSAVHDALYQLIREKRLPAVMRGAADEIFHNICIEDGMWSIRAKLWLFAVKNFAGFASMPQNDRPILIAP